ncbi:MAG: alpha/beta hydrolase [Microthrixaceae bacterium]|nr:alpha/beta hydrolase [Microthrixaceae bacterium]
MRLRGNTAGRNLLKQGLFRSAVVAGTYKPQQNSWALTVPTFFTSWLTSEAAPAVITLWTARTIRELVRRGDGEGASDGTGNDSGLGVEGWVGLGLSVASIAAVGNLISEALRSREQYRASLAPLVSIDEQEQAPPAVRAGAVMPFVFGNQRRQRTRNIVFNQAAVDSGGPRLKLDVYQPLNAPAPGEKRPAILQIHGGAWILGSKDEQGIPLLNHLASCGWVGFNANYRLSSLSPKVRYPDHLVDCKTALAWIREHADEYNVDPNFIVVTGGSAGGHLCALVALTQNDPAFQPGFEDADTSIQAAVPFYGVYDFTDRLGLNGPQFRELLERIVMGMSINDDPEAWSAYSPIDRITEDAPPMMVIHGDRDALVPVDGARAFVEKLRETSKNPVVYSELHGAQHAFEIFPSIRTINTVESVERFLHHVHEDYLNSREASAGAVEPEPDTADV